MDAQLDDRQRTAAVLVAHPDDETIWAGGTILSHPSWSWYVATLCRANDADRAPRFRRALRELGATGTMADLDDGPEQIPLDPLLLHRTILDILPAARYDLLLTHDPAGEYTRHRRHEEASRSAIELWQAGTLPASELWTFAYEDGGRQYLPRAIEKADVVAALSEAVWQRKYAIITGVYGFPPEGFEAKTTPRTEAFWRFTDPAAAQRWAESRGGRP